MSEISHKTSRTTHISTLVAEDIQRDLIEYVNQKSQEGICGGCLANLITLVALDVMRQYIEHTAKQDSTAYPDYPDISSWRLAASIIHTDTQFAVGELEDTRVKLEKALH